MRELWFESAGVRLFAAEDGEGPVIVMLHGGMASHVASLPLVAPLISRYRIVTPDLGGNGKSWSGERLTFDQLADDVVALLNHLAVTILFIRPRSPTSMPKTSRAARSCRRRPQT